ncbi:MAG: GTP-binding protein [Gemmatimonadota bacterium]
MSSSSRQTREVATRVVYWGPRGSGKTETLRAVFDRVDPSTRGPLLTPADEQDRTLFMDFLTVELGALDGVSLRLHLVGLPGGDALSESSQALLRGADGFVFVADSSPDRQADNRAALESLRRHLVASGETLRPVILQFNRRDHPEAVPAEAMAAELSPSAESDGWFETVATSGSGVIETLTAVASRVVGNLSAAAGERSGT